MKKILLGFLIVAALSACSNSKEKEIDMPTQIKNLNETVEVNAETLTEVKLELEEAQIEAAMMTEYMKMVKSFEGSGATVTEVNNGLKLTLPGNSAFKSGKAMLNPEIKTVLDPIAESLMAYPRLNAIIKGHTDNTGTEELNQKLSEDRAVEVSKYLVDKGIDSSRIGIIGVGSSEPVDDNDNEEGKMANRRVDITITY